MSTIKAGTTSTTAYQVEADTTGDLVIATGASANVAMTVNSAGNMGLGVTPSAWQSTRRVVQVGANGGALWGINSGAGTCFLSNNTYYDGTNFKYINTANATYYAQANDGKHEWYTAASGTAGNNATFSQNMVLDASGNLGVGTTSPAFSGVGTAITINSTDASTGTILSLQSAANNRGYLFGNSTNVVLSAVQSIPLIFKTVDTERARITDAGYLLVNSTDQASTGARIVSKDSGYCYGATTTTANTSDVYYFNFVSSAAAQNGYIWRSTSTGVTQLTSGSDARLKEDIVDASFNGLSVVSNVKVREFTWKDSGNRSVGFIAQELYEACPDAVAVGKDDSEGNIERPWGVSREALVPYLVKAIQEQQAMIDELKAEVAALKAG